MRCTTPAVLNPRSSWVAGWMLPLPETVDWTTPLRALTMRACPLLACPGAPTISAASAISAMAPAPRATVSQRGGRCRREVMTSEDRDRDQEPRKKYRALTWFFGGDGSLLAERCLRRRRL